MAKGKTQLDRFKEAARQLEADDDESRFEERLRKIIGDRTGNKENHNPSNERVGDND